MRGKKLVKDAIPEYIEKEKKRRGQKEAGDEDDERTGLAEERDCPWIVREICHPDVTSVKKHLRPISPFPACSRVNTSTHY